MRKQSVIFILLTVFLISGTLMIHQLSCRISAQDRQITALRQQLVELETFYRNYEQTLVHVLTGNGATMPVLSTAGLKAEDLEKAWSKLGAQGLAGTGAAIIQAETETGVNSLVLASIAYLESGAGSSKIAGDKNNLFGLGAVDSNPYAGALSFETKENSIYYAATLLNGAYLSRDGKYYHGDNLEAIGLRYATDPQWAEKVGQTMLHILLAILL